MRPRARSRSALPVAAAVGAALAGLGAASSAASAQDGPPAAAQPPAPRVFLSDERTETRWATPVARARVRKRPSRDARTVDRLRFVTEDGFPEVYLARVQWRDARGGDWVKIRLPGRPNGRQGWVPRAALGPFRTVRTLLVVERRRFRVTLLRDGRRIFSAKAGVGAPPTPTPRGRFWIREKFRVGDAPLYGPRAIGTSAYAPTLTDWPGGGVVGLHGTDEPWLVPGRPSHGCIRLRNRDIVELYRLLPVGTPLRVV